MATRIGDVDTVELLLDHGADPSMQTVDNYTPLHIAAKDGHEDIARILLARQESNKSCTRLTTKVQPLIQYSVLLVMNF